MAVPDQLHYAAPSRLTRGRGGAFEARGLRRRVYGNEAIGRQEEEEEEIQLQPDTEPVSDRLARDHVPYLSSAPHRSCFHPASAPREVSGRGTTRSASVHLRPPGLWPVSQMSGHVDVGDGPWDNGDQDSDQDGDTDNTDEDAAEKTHKSAGNRRIGGLAVVFLPALVLSALTTVVVLARSQPARPVFQVPRPTSSVTYSMEPLLIYDDIIEALRNSSQIFRESESCNLVSASFAPVNSSSSFCPYPGNGPLDDDERALLFRNDTAPVLFTMGALVSHFRRIIASLCLTLEPLVPGSGFYGTKVMTANPLNDTCGTLDRRLANARSAIVHIQAVLGTFPDLWWFKSTPLRLSRSMKRMQGRIVYEASHMHPPPPLPLPIFNPRGWGQRLARMSAALIGRTNASAAHTRHLGLRFNNRTARDILRNILWDVEGDTSGDEFETVLLSPITDTIFKLYDLESDLDAAVQHTKRLIALAEEVSSIGNMPGSERMTPEAEQGAAGKHLKAGDGETSQSHKEATSQLQPRASAATGDGGLWGQLTMALPRWVSRGAKGRQREKKGTWEEWEAKVAGVVEEEFREEARSETPKQVELLRDLLPLVADQLRRAVAETAQDLKDSRDQLLSVCEQARQLMACPSDDEPFEGGHLSKRADLTDTVSSDEAFEPCRSWVTTTTTVQVLDNAGGKRNQSEPWVHITEWYLPALDPFIQATFEVVLEYLDREAELEQREKLPRIVFGQ